MASSRAIVLNRRQARRAPRHLIGFFLVSADDVARPDDCRFRNGESGLTFLSGDHERHREAVIRNDLDAPLVPLHRDYESLTVFG